MKKFIILTIAFLMQCGMLSGQTVVRTALVEDTATGYACGILRSWGSTKALAFHVRDGLQLFSIIDSASRTVYSAKVPDFYAIRDFRIVGDTAYCCGSSHDSAMIAYFDINAIQMSSTISFNVAIISGLRMVTRLATYRIRGTSNVGIAAIGEEVKYITPYYVSRCYMIWGNNYSSSTFSFEKRMCDCDWNITSLSEKLNDVVVTDQYVVYVGIYTNTNTLCIRKGDKNNVFSPSPSLIDTVHRFTYLFNTFESLPIAEPLERDTLAIAVACEDMPDEHSEQIHLFDLSNMTMYNAQRIKLSGEGKVSVNELVYMRNQRKLLTEVESSVGHQIIYTKPSAFVSYYAKTLAPSTGDIICSMDRHNGSYYILSTLRHWMLQRMGAMPPSDTCIREDSREVFIWTVSLDSPKCHLYGTSSDNTIPRRLYSTRFNTALSCVNF